MSVDRKEGFIRWFLETQLVKSKAPVWREFFMNAATMTMISLYSYMLLSGIKISNEFYMLLSMVLGFYFNSKHDQHEPPK